MPGTAVGSREIAPFEDGRGFDCIAVTVCRRHVHTARTIRYRALFSTDVPFPSTFAYPSDAVVSTNKPTRVRGLVRSEQKDTSVDETMIWTTTLRAMGADATPRLRVK